ncbi:MAG: phytoene desaturase [Planctomycetales bacterium]|nr:phytoene desaturase [Planctomycetales bacterium]
MGNRPRVVIVGAGPGGLAAAMQLSHAGLQVTVLEKQTWVGGRTATFQQGGFSFDVGPTFFLYPRVLEEIFASVGRDLFREIPMKRLFPQYRIRFGTGGQIDATADLEQLEQQIQALSPSDAGAISRYMRDNRRKLARFRPILESPFDGWRNYLHWHMLAALPYLKPWRSLACELNHYFKDPRLAIAFSFQSKYLGMSPFKCPSLFSILSFLEYEYGVFHPRGGCGAVSTRMAEIAVELGAEMRLAEPVTGFSFQGRRPTVVHTNHASYAADAVVINADFALAMRDLVPNSLRRRWSDERIASKRFSCSTFMMYLGLNKIYQDLPHHSIYIADDYSQNLREIEDLRVLPRDPSFYVQNAAVTDSSLAPKGKSGIYVLVPVPHLDQRHSWTEATTAQFRVQILNQLARIGLDDIQPHIETERIITPVQWNEDFGLYRGSTFNLMHNLGQMLHRRPHNRFEDLQNVFLVGGGTHPGSGLPVIYESARIVCKQLLRMFGIRRVATSK